MSKKASAIRQGAYITISRLFDIVVLASISIGVYYTPQIYHLLYFVSAGIVLFILLHKKIRQEEQERERRHNLYIKSLEYSDVRFSRRPKAPEEPAISERILLYAGYTFAISALFSPLVLLSSFLKINVSPKKIFYIISLLLIVFITRLSHSRFKDSWDRFYFIATCCGLIPFLFEFFE